MLNLVNDPFAVRLLRYQYRVWSLTKEKARSALDYSDLLRECRYRELRQFAEYGSDIRLRTLSIRFDSPANNVGPWPASLGCTTNSYSSINPSSANASGSFTPPTNSPLPDSRLSCSTAVPRSHALAPRSNRPGPGCSTRHTSLPRRSPGEGFHPIRPRSCPRRRPERCLHHFVSHPAKEERIGPVEVLDGVSMQVFGRWNDTMIAAPVQCDVDGIPKGSHCGRVSPMG